MLFAGSPLPRGRRAHWEHALRSIREHASELSASWRMRLAEYHAAAEGWLVDSRRPAPRTARASAAAVPEPYLRWFGVLAAVVLGLALLVGLGGSPSQLSLQRPIAALAETVAAEMPGALPNRTSCAEIEGTDLRSPLEGVWYESNCGASPTRSECNRTSLEGAQFSQVAPGLFIYHSPRTWPVYLWYARSEGCYDLVSSRVVTAVCADQTVTFSWREGACAAHGGLLASINRRTGS